jgi:DNA polymerase-3 subunit beta
MKLIILKEKLKEAIKTVERVSQKSLSLPVLQNTLLKTEKNFLKLSTTNLESSITWQGLAKVEREGQVCVPTRFLSSFINFLPDKPINIEVRDFVLNISCENYEIKINGLNPEEFPIIPQIKESEIININNYEFCQSLSQILNIPSTSTSRPEISGIFFLFEKNLIKMVATDSFRLAEKKLFLKSNISKEYSLILPQSAAKEIFGVFGEKEGDIKIYLSPNQVLFEHTSNEVGDSKIQFTSRLIEGEYPNYEEIIPKKYEIEMQVPKKEFLNQIKTASLFSGKINEVKIKVNSKNGKVEILSKSPDLGEYKSFIKTKVKGRDIVIAFNHRFLIDGVSEINSEELSFNLTNEEGPSALRALGSNDYLYILMPIKA